MDKPHHNQGKRYAAKPPEDVASSHLHIRCKKTDKAQWCEAAYPGKLSEWVIDTLNNQAKKDAK